MQSVVKETFEEYSFSSSITGTGSVLASIKIDNDKLLSSLDTSDQWIQERVGIKSRNICSANESNLDLAFNASKLAINAAGIEANQIDLIIYATVTPDQQVPAMACLLGKRLGIEKTLAFDLQAACSGFIFALTSADALLKSLNLKNALIVGSETLSRITDWKDRNTAVLFGDGAGACILHRPTSDADSCIMTAYLKAFTSGTELIKCAGVNRPATHETMGLALETETESLFVKMQGKEVFKAGVNLMCESINAVLDQAKITVKDVKLFIPHQSNLRMIESVCKNIGIPTSKMASNLEYVGNTSAASIPIVLDECVRSKRIESGDIILLTAVGGGMTYGSVLLRL